ncbi:MAG: malonyl-CoA decarboxylase family protein, partial [Sphingobium sp.]
QVAADLKRSLPNLEQFATLSPVPGFRPWLAKTTAGHADEPLVARLDDEHWWKGSDAPALQAMLMRRVVEYFRHARNGSGRPFDPVARFHLGNGARLERVNWLADLSENGLRQSAGIMVNYLYDLDSIEENHEAFAHRGELATGEPFQTMAASMTSTQPSSGVKTR